MLKQAAVTLTELALFGGLVALVAGGCNDSATLPTPESSLESSSWKTQYVDAGPEFQLASEAAALQAENQKITAEKEEGADAMTKLEDTPLIPRDVLFGNPKRAQARLSPDGKWLSFLAPVNGVLNVWVGPVDNFEQAVAVTDDTVRGIRSHSWAYNSRHIVYTQDKAGDENWHVYATEVKTKETKDLTPIDGVNARLSGASEKFPDEVLVGLNDREPRLHDIWRINLNTGERELVQQNPGVAGFVADDDYNVRLAVNFTRTGG
ncbi:MAG: S9 family peptidase, partial [Planctomycetota bacterium]